MPKGEVWTNYGASIARVDQYSGELLMTQDVTEIPLGNKILRWQFPLHNGDALGIVGRWLILITGLVPALLFATGSYLWWKKRRLQRQKASAVSGAIQTQQASAA